MRTSVYFQRPQCPNPLCPGHTTTKSPETEPRIVIYRGGRLIPGANHFINELRRAEVPFRFLTNNSQRTRRDIATRLQRLDIDVEEEHVYTCAQATARFLAEKKPQGTAFVIGEGGLLNAPHDYGYSIVDKDPDYVVVAEGRIITKSLA